MVLGLDEGLREKAAQEEGRPVFFFPALTGWANLCRAYGAGVKQIGSI
jgi:hypothetical protein